MTEDELHQALRAHDDPPPAEALAQARRSLLRAARADLGARAEVQTQRRRRTAALALALAACAVGFVLGRSSAPPPAGDGPAAVGPVAAREGNATRTSDAPTHQTAAKVAPGTIPKLVEAPGLEGSSPGRAPLEAQEVDWIQGQAKDIARGDATRIRRTADLHQGQAPAPSPKIPPGGPRTAPVAAPPLQALSPAPTSTAPAKEIPAPPPRASNAPKGPTPRVDVAAPSPSAAELAFQAGWAALEAGDNLNAARHFRVASDSKETLAEDASYWHAEALHRGGRQAAAELALAEHLRRFPNSPRAAAAHLRLGAWLLGSGRREAAAQHLDAAIRTDPTLAPEVREIRDAHAQP